MEIQEKTPIIFYVFAGTGLIGFFLFFFLAFFALYRKRLTQKEKEMLQRENDYQFNLIKKTIETQETEKIRLAKDLHDEIGSMLTLLKYAINQLQAEITEPNKANRALEVLDKIMLDFKAVCRDLIPSSIKNFGLLQTLAEVIENTKANSDIDIQYDLIDAKINIAIEKKLSVYRLFKEVLNNIVKHSHSKHINIVFVLAQNNFNIHFDYDGQGITNEDIQRIRNNSTSIGIQSIDTRLLALAGHINYIKEESKYSIHIRIPLWLNHPKLRLPL